MPARPLPRPAGLIRRAALPAAAAALTLVTGLLPAQAATPGWRVTEVLPASTEIYSTAATSAANAWGGRHELRGSMRRRNESPG